MNLVELKTAKELELAGVKVSFTTQDKSIRELVMTSGGKRFIVKVGSTYSDAIKIYRADEFTTEKKWVLEGDILGVKVSEAFDSRNEAISRQEELKSGAEKSVLTIDERDVKIDGLVASLIRY